ncbi:MAG: hypothetical protein J5I93_24845 [Pirellulaceae bacterium]|nr:hypothetical protein [Pirellulaceae bacterium]
MPPTNPNRRRIRWMQLSLRTLLLAMVLVSLAMWWYLRPRPAEMSIGGGYVLRTEQRTRQDETTGQPTTIRHGLAEIVDQHGRVRVRGRYQFDRPHGLWTWYDERGAQRLSGRCVDGRRDGVWTGWHANGGRQFAVTHGVAMSLGKGQLVPWTDDLAANHRQMQEQAADQFQVAVAPLALVAWRDGPAATWWDNGRPQSRGSYRHDRREGHWTFWDREGRRLASGSFASGERQGTWQVWDGSAGRETTVYYVRGVRYPPLEQLTGRLIEHISTGDAERRARALRLAVQLKSDGLSVLQAAIGSSDEQLRRMALAALVPLGPQALPLADELSGLAETEPGLRFESLLALWAADVTRRRATLERFLRLAAELPAAERPERLADLNQFELAGLEQLEVFLASREPQLRHTAFEAIACQVAPPRLNYAFQVTSGAVPGAYFARLGDVLQRAAGHPDPAIAAAAAELPKLPGVMPFGLMVPPVTDSGDLR